MHERERERWQLKERERERDGNRRERGVGIYRGLGEGAMSAYAVVHFSHMMKSKPKDH